MSCRGGAQGEESGRLSGGQRRSEQDTACPDNAFKVRAPHVSDFRIKIYSRVKIAQNTWLGIVKNARKIVEVGNQVWNTFHN
jgi:hypothetical protein